MSLSDWLGIAPEREPIDKPFRATQAALAAAQELATTGPSIGQTVDSNTPPYDGIVTIYDQIGSNYYQASGELISPDEVLTASHVVYSSGQSLATNIEVIAGGSASDYGTLYYGDNFH